MSAPEKLMLDLAEATSDYWIVFDETGQLLYANPAFVRTFLGGAPIAGSNLFSLVHPFSVSQGREAIAAVRQGPQNMELYHLEKDGGLRPVQYSLCRVEGAVGAIGREKAPDFQLMCQLAEASARVEQMAGTDTVTGLYNRRYFLEVVEHLFEEASRYGLPLCCFVLDLDGFRSLNNRWGDEFGDHVLKGVAGRLREATRRADVLARYGGDEFVLASPDTDLKTGLLLAERLCAALGREPLALGNVQATVTLSLGLSGTELLDKGPLKRLLETAEQALDCAKRAGGNRYRVYWPEGPEPPRVTQGQTKQKERASTAGASLFH